MTAVWAEYLSEVSTEKGLEQERQREIDNSDALLSLRWTTLTCGA